MYRCEYCEREFEQPKEIHTNYESLYGVSGEFGGSTPCTLYFCPYCEREDFEEIDDEDLEE